MIGIILSFPVTYIEFKEVEWTALPFFAIWRMGFVVIGTTFLTYMLNMYALKSLPASTIGAFIYIQPLIAIFYAIITGNDSLCLLYTSPSPRDKRQSRMPSSA